MNIVLKRIVAGLMLVLWAGMALAQSEYRVRSGDRLSIEVLEDNSLNRTVQVLPDGRFNFPFAGSLPASGRTVGQIQSSITEGISSSFANPPTVFVSVTPAPAQPVIPSGPAAPVTITVYLLGEVAAPGPKEVLPGTTFLQALSQSGGLTNFAATKRIQLRSTDARGAPRVYSINYKAIANGASLSQDPQLREGDVILVPERRLFE